MKITRQWAMPNSDTFQVPCIGEFVRQYTRGASVIVDPFARNSSIGTITNDLSKDTAAQYHMDANDFMDMLIENGTLADVVIFDPPYSPRQISEVYQSVGRVVTTEDTQAATWSAWKDRICKLVKVGGVCLSFGWNSSGIGKGNLFRIDEILLVAHGGWHNDTICVAETKLSEQLRLL